MKACSQIQKTVLGLALLSLCIPVPADAQLIAVKSVPVASGDQFLVLPSENLGMGGVAVALDDEMLDPFINPAKGSRNSTVRFFSAPTIYSISNNNGAARSLPLGLLLGTRKWFGGISMAIQQLEAPKPTDFNIIPWIDFVTTSNTGYAILKDKTANNMFVSGFLGRKFYGPDLAIAAGVSWSSLHAVDGVELLYVNSEKIEQFGDMLDVRIGLLHEWQPEHVFEAMLIYHRFDMTHDVTYPNWLRPQEPPDQFNGVRTERNLDQSRTWGLHFGYVQPLSRQDWKIGGIVTGNRKIHPKIPNYDLMNIPRDPGDTWAFNFGAGISRADAGARFSADLVFEPIWSNTWADAAEDLTSINGHVIRKGDKTIINDFKFENWLFRIGIARQQKIFGFQLGLQVRFINYHLDQVNKIEEFDRSQTENWAEWTPTIGLNVNFPEFQIRYSGRLTSGTGRPGVISNWQMRAESDFANSADFIVAPSGDLTLQDAIVVTHQIYIAIPID